jgi:alpha-amylase
MYEGEASCFDEWVCEHRWPAIAGMGGLSQRTTQAAVERTDWWSNNANQIAFWPGELGFVAINREAQP